MILLNDLLNFSEDEKNRAKIKFNIYNGEENPIELYKSNPDQINKEWLYWRNKKRYFDVGQIAICFVRIDYEHWLLTTIDNVIKELDVKDGVNYLAEPIEKYKSYFGRVIVKFHKSTQSMGYNYKTIADELEVSQILPDSFDDDEFEGYDNVYLSFEKLERIITRHKMVWVNALAKQKAVYLITDTNTGKLYVGSATSDNGMLLQRWANYVNNGHGGNKELKELVDQKGFDYVKKYFTYTILENYNSKIDDDFILKRESYWKNVLQSRWFGYNAN